MTDADVYQHLIDEHLSKRKYTDNNAQETKLEVKDYFKHFEDAIKCKYGENCQRRATCTFYHGNDDRLKRQFCECKSSLCDRPHPTRNKQKRKHNCLSTTKHHNHQQQQYEHQQQQQTNFFEKRKEQRRLERFDNYVRYR